MNVRLWIAATLAAGIVSGADMAVRRCLLKAFQGHDVEPAFQVPGMQRRQMVDPGTGAAGCWKFSGFAGKLP